jgi:4-hydroxybenzoyl-CoA reductase subunit beta
MHLPAHEFIKAGSLAETLAALRASAGEVKLLAGGTDVIFNMRGRLFQPDVLLSLRGLPELQGVTLLPDGSLQLGAGTRLTDLERAPALARYPALVKACRSVASRHVRNMATLGGNLCLDTRCWYTNQTAEWRAAKGPCLKTGVDACHAIKGSPVCVALNASDIAPVLIALDARVTLRSVDSERAMPLAEFYTDDGIRHTQRRADEILTEVTIPPTDDALVFLKETARKGNDFSYGVIAARANHWRLVLGSLTTRPVRLRGPARLLAEQGLSDTAIASAVAAVRGELGALTNLYSPAAYKRALARQLVEQALLELREIAA